MTKTIGFILTVVFVSGSVLGTAASGWLLGDAISPERPGAPAPGLSISVILVLLAVAVEGLRLTLSVSGERIWRRSQFQGAAFAGPLWLACTGYCTLMPLLALAFVPMFPVASPMPTIFAPVWAIVQIAAGLLPGITWSVAEVSKPAVTAHPHPHLPAEAREAPAPQSAASADDFLRFLSRLSELPAGSTLPRKGRIGFNREIVISQAGLAALVGRSKPTVRRWLQELERGAHIAKRTAGKDTCILLQQHVPKPNGDARKLNGEAHI